MTDAKIRVKQLQEAGWRPTNEENNEKEESKIALFVSQKSAAFSNPALHRARKSSPGAGFTPHRAKASNSGMGPWGILTPELQPMARQ